MLLQTFYESRITHICYFMSNCQTEIIIVCSVK